MAKSLDPGETLSKNSANARVLLISCGALAREIVDLIELNKWTAFDIECLPAKWHNTPEKIVPGVREKIRTRRHGYQRVYVLYGDCGTGGELDALLHEEGVERIDGPHCYAFFSGNPAFAKRAEDDMTSFFLTDYLARQFDKLVWEGLGLDRHPELLTDYFQHYRKLVYLAQVKDEALESKAAAAAKKLGLAYEYRFTGYGELESDLAKLSN
jgi:Protein of unknown function (DUF1638)